MVLGVYLALDQHVLYNDNYSDVSGLKLTGTIYSDVSRTTAFTLTGYTITLRLFRNSSKSDNFAGVCTITVAGSGTFYISVTSSTLPISGLYNCIVELSKSGTVVSSLNREEILVRHGP